VLLYHLATGTFPVTAASLAELRAAHAEGRRRLLRDARPDLPQAFVHAVDRATAFDPAERPDSAGKLERLLEIALGVRSIDDAASGPLPEIAASRPSLLPHARIAWRKTMAIATALAAVVGVAGWLALTAPSSGAGNAHAGSVHAITVAPLDVKNGDATWGTIARTMAADIARHLDGPGLLVKGRSLPIRQGETDVVAQAHQLGADAVVTGTLTVSDRDLVLDVAVLDTVSQRAMFQKRYATAPTQVESLPLRVSADITSALGFTGAAPAGARQQVSLEAYDHYARGRQLAEQREPTALVRATEQFEETIRLEPAYAPAWAELADAYIALGVPAFGPLRPFEARGKAREAALRALDLDPNLAEAHTALAFLSYFHDWNWQAADERFVRALRLNPNDSQAHHWYADYLNAMGRFEEATMHINAACELEPLSILFQRDVGWHLFFQRRYADAISQLQHTLAKEPTYVPAISLLGRALVQHGDVAAGITELQRLDLTSPANQAMLAYAYAAAGDRAQATAWLARINTAAAAQYVSPYSVALVEAALGNKERALERLNAAFEEQDSTIVNLFVDPRFDGLRSDARFGQLLARLRFPVTVGAAQ
jgi:tetratricopeptide (TPR) repeat protein